MWAVDQRTGRVLAVIAVGGVLGSLGRFGLAEIGGGLAVAHVWATLAVNVIGSFAIGILATRLPATHDAWWHRPFWITGVLGGFTTFSAFALDAATLLDDGQTVTALAYVVGRIVAGLLAAALGQRIAGGSA